MTAASKPVPHARVGKYDRLRVLVLFLLRRMFVIKHEVFNDLSRVGWAKALKWASLSIVGSGLLTMLLLLPHVGADSSLPSFSSACTPDASFDPFHKHSQWDIRRFFQITLAFGDLNFTQAKVIDVAWDVIIGRLGQALIAYLSWRSFSAYTTASMHFKPIPYRVFRTLFVNREPTLMSIVEMFNDFTSGRCLESRFVMSFMVVTMLLTLVFPTLASAMAGYTPRNAAYITDYNHNLAEFSRFRPVMYIIHDGSRIGLTDEYPVALWNDSLTARDFSIDSLYSFAYKTSLSVCFRYNPDIDPSTVPLCRIQHRASKYVADYGYFGTNMTTSAWNNITLPSPTLNISSTFPSSLHSHILEGDSDHGVLPFKPDWDSESPGRPLQHQSSSDFALTYSDALYDGKYIQKYGSCQSLLDTASDSPEMRYSWGFSFIQLFVVLAVLNVWAVGTYLVWLKGQLTLEILCCPCIPNEYRAILDLADSLTTELHQNDYDPALLNSQEVCSVVEKDLKGGNMLLPLTFETRIYRLVQGLWAWLREEGIWSIIGGILAVIVLSLSLHLYGAGFRVDSLGWYDVDLFVVWLWSFCLFFTLAYVLSVNLGSTFASRVSLFAVGGVVAIGAAFGMIQYWVSTYY